MVKMGERPFKFIFMYKRKDLTHKKKKKEKEKKKTHTHTTTHSLASQMKSLSEKHSREKTESREYS